MIASTTLAFTSSSGWRRNRRISSSYLFQKYQQEQEQEQLSSVANRAGSQSQSLPPSMVLTPYRINQDGVFGPDVDGSDIQKPLHIVIDLIQQSLHKIIDSTVDMASILRLSEDNDTQLLPPVLRIEHTISHSVDPLCWLHHQTRHANTHPVLYFGTAEQSIEAAVIGSAYTHFGAADDDLWKVIHALPPASHVYGGERFDTATRPHDEWTDFGTGLWILPAVELRRTAEATSSNLEEGVTLSGLTTTTLSVNLYKNNNSTWSHAARKAMEVLSTLTADATSAVPPTNLPPVMSRDASPSMDGQHIYERGVTAALHAFATTPLEKVVLARRSQLVFDKHAKLSALDMLCKWKFGGNEGGHLFYLYPGDTNAAPGHGEQPRMKREFFGCTPERLFRISGQTVVTEALAGTRPRGSTQEADAQLSRDLYADPKDRFENEITGRFIRDQLLEANDLGLTKKDPSIVDDSSRYFVRRLRHLQHICQRFQCPLNDGVNAAQVSKFLLHGLNPTPAVCGYPANEAIQFIRNMETTAFDRGFYSGPFGFLGKDASEVVVAIRSGLASTPMSRGTAPSTVSVYAGAGVVPGSTVQGEWSETSYKLNVVSSLFPQAPITLSTATTPNVAWSTAFVEELIRCGITQFYVCPGSRSTPLVAAIAKALRTNLGVINAVSVHDERGAGFRAIGYARATGRPAAVITSSGTAIANLYPAIMEAGMDAIPMMILTADRPYESRDTGSNQAIDQVKAYSSTYIRWFRDIPPPSDDVPVSLVLSDTNHAVTMSMELKGPVHLNIQFRENLSPDAGPIRNDNRVDSLTSFNSLRFTDAPAFQRWSTGGDRWMQSYYQSRSNPQDEAAIAVATMIAQSRRGIIVVGNVRSSDEQNEVADTISQFAEQIGFPIFAGVQSGNLRSRSLSVIPYAEHVLKHPTVAAGAKPDFILQIGHPLISSEVPRMIKDAVARKDGNVVVNHVLLHPHHPNERSDPDLIVSHRVSSEVVPFLRAVVKQLQVQGMHDSCSSALSPMILLGRRLQDKMPQLITEASNRVVLNSRGQTTSGSFDENVPTLTEPQIVMTMAGAIGELDLPISLFLSNSMPVRDGEFFLYPKLGGLSMLGVNRGASGIDGIISSANGFSEGTGRPTCLLIGDLASLHDINSFHALAETKTSSGSQKKAPITTVVVNNDGGGIFSFLPVAKHGNDVNFDEFFGTPTNSFSFKKGAEAFGLRYREAHSSSSFADTYKEAMQSRVHNILEAKVVNRELNVAVHKEISTLSCKAIDDLLESDEMLVQKLPAKFYTSTDSRGVASSLVEEKTFLLLHGWMGEKTDWDEVGLQLAQSLPSEWSVLAMDLPGHGNASSIVSSDSKLIHGAFGLSSSGEEMSIERLATSVMKTLCDDYGISRVDAVAGYSLGGRVALAMKELCSVCVDQDGGLVSEDTTLILLGANPGQLPVSGSFVSSAILRSQATEDRRRKMFDDSLSENMAHLFMRSRSMSTASSQRGAIWSSFVDKWYNAPLWGDMKRRKPKLYENMVRNRIASLDKRGKDISVVLRDSSPGRQNTVNWNIINAGSMLILAGELDAKYVEIGEQWASLFPEVSFATIANSGHALLVEDSDAVANAILKFIMESKAAKKSKGPQDGKTETSASFTNLTSIPAGDTARASDQGRAPAFVVVSQPEIAGVKLQNNMFPSKAIGGLDFEAFSIAMVGDNQESGVRGIGWGEKAAADTRMHQRSGFILQLVSEDRSIVGIGEVSPLPGLHPEGLVDAKKEIVTLQKLLEGSKNIPVMLEDDILAMQGGLNIYIQALLKALSIKPLSPSVKSGLEMALLSYAAQIKRLPLLNAISASGNALVLNGLQMRGSSQRAKNEASIRYSSLKVKVGHQSAQDDAAALTRALQDTLKDGKIRADANRAWDDSRAIEFASALEVLDVNFVRRIEFVEEPLQKVHDSKWSIRLQIEALERWYQHSGIKYALDESIADLAADHNGDFGSIAAELENVFEEGIFGCAALVLKPSLLGLELSMQIARLANSSLGVGSIFSSSFDSGVGLAYTAFLAAATEPRYAHGIGTFSMLAGDTLSPSFGSYVNDKGVLQVASLSRALYGLGLDEMRGSFSAVLPEEEPTDDNDNYQASTATSSSGRELSVVVSLPLPFSDVIASSRFTDLPQQSRWSPWLSSVAYLDAGRETEWTLNVRGARFSWRAVSDILETPYRGIQWKSVSGLGNLGVVEFVPTDPEACLMKVRMTILVPRLLATLFPGASVFLEDFLQNKLLKWSLEMFRDVVKGDLALERGDVELGDALFGAVEGRANAIEATLSLPPMSEQGSGK